MFFTNKLIDKVCLININLKVNITVMPIKYTQQEILENFANKNEEERNEWLKQHTDEEIVEIMNAMIEIAESIPEIANDKNFSDKTTNLKIDIGLFENAIIDEKVNKMMQEIELQANIKAADEAYQNLRRALIKHLLENKDDKESIDIARQFIEAEKANEDYYEEDNWKDILHLL